MSPSERQLLIRQAIKILELQIKTLELARADSGVLLILSEMLDHLRLNFLNSGHSRSNSNETDSLENQRIRNLTADEVEAILFGRETSRSTLENLAVMRFGVPKGSIRKLGDKDGLREKIATMLRNENVHRTIGEMARRRKATLTGDD